MPVDGTHQVTLDYTADGQGNFRVAQPPTIKVKHGHKIKFNRGTTVPPDAKVVVIFTEPQFFSVALVDEGQVEVTVTATLPHSTFYQCGFRALDGHIIPTSL